MTAEALNPISAQESPLEQFINDCKQRVNLKLDQHLSQSCPSVVLREAMRYACLGGGKRVRPVLVYGAARSVGLSVDAVDDIACAVELMHSYSLVHDDLPAMDDDDLRRGQPTVHKAFDEATAILVGDSLQALALQVIANSDSSAITSDTRMRMISTLCKAAGAAGMVGGQALDFEAVGTKLSLTQLENMHSLKTGALIVASIELGALAGADMDELQLNSLRSYAENIGLAFQVRDDILDVTSDTSTLGKPQGSDQSLNKPTYVALLGLGDAKAKASTLAHRAIADLEDFSPDADRLRELALYIVERVH